MNGKRAARRNLAENLEYVPAGVPCDRCATTDHPRIGFNRLGAMKVLVTLCVRCLADGIQSATGWKMHNMLTYYLSVSPFYNPRPKKSKRKEVR